MLTDAKCKFIITCWSDFVQIPSAFGTEFHVSKLERWRPLIHQNALCVSQPLGSEHWSLLARVRTELLASPAYRWAGRFRKNFWSCAFLTSFDLSFCGWVNIIAYCLPLFRGPGKGIHLEFSKKLRKRRYIGIASQWTLIDAPPRNE